jgi:hypothetical protein
MQRIFTNLKPIQMKFKTLLIFLFSLVLVSCGTTKTETSEKQKEIIKEIVHDTTFVTVADTATYKALLDCQNGKVVVKNVLSNTEGKNHLKKPKVKIDNNQITVDCEAKAQKLFAQWKSQQKETVITKTIPVEIEKPLTLWQRVQMWAGDIFLLLLLILAIGWFLKFKKII